MLLNLPLKSYRRPLLGSEISAIAAPCHDDQPVLDCKSTKSFWINKRKNTENAENKQKYLEDKTDGKLVYKGNDNSKQKAELKKGLYILEQNGKTKKVIIK